MLILFLFLLPGCRRLPTIAPKPTSPSASSPTLSEEPGSSIIYDVQEHIVTNYHVIENAESIVGKVSDDTQVGQTVSLALLRDGRSLKLPITISAQSG